jgi:hypothetical protein
VGCSIFRANIDSHLHIIGLSITPYARNMGRKRELNPTATYFAGAKKNEDLLCCGGDKS